LPPTRAAPTLDGIDAAGSGRRARRTAATIDAMTRSVAFTVFATAIGDCALAWNEVGVVAAWLPECSPGRLRSRIANRFPNAAETAPDAAIAAAVAAITALLRGERTDLGAVGIDDSRLAAFDRRVYAAARTIAAGRVVSYGELAERVGADATAREVGASLGRNPFPIIVPCHRIVASDGELGGFSAPGGTATKRRLLTIEDARRDGVDDLFDAPAATPSAPA
jgi:methylated-DNA-[protein]-cysteine S-methyltransferase